MQKNSSVQFLKITLVMSVVLIVMLLISLRSTGVTVSVRAAASDDPTIIHLSPRAFAVNTQLRQPMLELHGDVCHVHVYTGDSSHITVHTTIRHYQENHMPTINYRQTSDRSAVSIDEKVSPQSSPISDNVMMDIAVPGHIDLSLHTEVGGIDTSGVSGQLALTTATGNITVDGVQVRGQSSFTSNVGNISFGGRFAPKGVYRMSTHVGSIDLALQGSSSLRVNAQTNVGAISSGYPTVAVDRNSAWGNVGNAPDAYLSLVTGVGSISLF